MQATAKVNPRAIAALLMARHVRAAGHRPPPGPLPRQQPPDAIGLEYAAAMRALVERAIRAAYAPLLRALPAMLEHARRARGDAAEPSLVDRLVARLRGQPVTRHDDRTKEEVAAAEEAMASEVTDDRIRAAAAKAGQQADDLNRRQLGAQVKAVVGVDLVGTVPPALLDGFLDENVALISDITPALAARVQAAIHRALTTGQLHADLATVLDREMGYAADRAANIARDQIGKIYGQVNAKRQQDLGVTEFIWRTVGDERVRGNPGGKYPNAKPSHWDRDGKTYKYADPPRGAKGERELPGTPINCFPGESRVSSQAAVSKLYRRWYRGETTVLTTDEGRRLHATPNHPVLTARGWVPAHLVEVGDHLVETAAQGVDLAVGDAEDGQTTFAECFEALAPLGIAEERRTVLGGGFHGDAAIDDEVCVVDLDRGLFREGEPEFPEAFGEKLLALASQSPAASGPLALLFDRADATAHRLVGRGCQLATLLGAGLAHSLEHRRTAIAWLDSVADELRADGGAAHVEVLRELLHRRPVEEAGADQVTRVVAGVVRRAVNAAPRLYTASAEELAQVVAADPELARGLGDRAGVQKLSRVVEKCISEYAGHVYNLETGSGWYAVSSLAVHNCRCFGEPILKHLLDDLPDPGEGWQPPAALGVQLAPPPVVEGLTAVQHAAREARLAREAQTAADRAAWEAARAAKLAARQG